MVKQTLIQAVSKHGLARMWQRIHQSSRLPFVMLTGLMVIAVLAAFVATRDSGRVDAADGTYTLVGAGDIAMSVEAAEATAKVVDRVLAEDPRAVVFAAGDNVYWTGTDIEYANIYHPTWGRLRNRTMPVPGNHDYGVADAAGYMRYFCPNPSDCVFPAKSPQRYYSYDLGNWHIVSLDSERDVSQNSAQLRWLQQDLAANQNKCIAAVFHQPYFNSGTAHGGNKAMRPFWDVLYAAGADLALVGHEHIYERFGKQDPDGEADARGMRQFTIGTGGASLNTLGAELPNTEARQGNTEGVVRFKLTRDGYQWDFLAVEGKSYLDSGSDTCNYLQTDQAPTVSLTSPAANARVAGAKVQLRAEANDDKGIAGVTFQIDGKQVGGEVSLPPYTSTWDSREVADGQHSLVAIVRDQTGKSTASIPLSLTVDNTEDRQTVVDRRVATPRDDAVEGSGGSVVTEGGTLGLINPSVRMAGLRFSNVNVPRGAVIKRAYIQFTADGISADEARLMLYGQQADDAQPFAAAYRNMSIRARTAASVAWAPAPWTADGQSGAAQQTPDIAPIIQEIVDRPGWHDGNALSILIAGNGGRLAKAFDGSSTQSPVLHVEFDKDIAVPDAPADLWAVGLSSSQVQLDWPAVSDAGGVAGYRIYRGDRLVGTASGTSFIDGDLSANNNYTYSVVAYDFAGNASDSSIVAAVKTGAEALAPSVLTFDAVADATIKAAAPTSNFGSEPGLAADGNPAEHQLLKFTISGLQGKEIVSAKLRLFNIDASNRGGDIYRMPNNNWAEYGVNWLNAPLPDITPFASIGTVAAGRWHEVNALPVINGDGVYSFRIKNPSFDAVGYQSKEGNPAQSAQLVIIVQ
ncbi:DNRLRE domain-containing protein [Candidatus Saccharibacteria bacterium]|nr:DNRLRE domain-containing protein [Candidatus Saccharibacteria bacterium]